MAVQCEGREFSAKGKVIVQAGFKKIETAFRMTVQKGKRTETEDDTAPAIPEGLSEGMEIAAVRTEKSRHFTAPPKPYSEDTLLSAMETAGNKEFDADTEKKQILPTADGMALIAVLPDYLKSAAMTAEWENKLLLMEKGQLTEISTKKII